MTRGWAQGAGETCNKRVDNYYRHRFILERPECLRCIWNEWQIPDVITNVINTYVGQRSAEESFIETYRRLGVAPFKEAAYKDKSENAKKKEIAETVGSSS